MPGHALVTGASSGIGAVIVKRLLSSGWQVTGVARRATRFDVPGYASIEADLGTSAGCDAVLARVEGITAFVHAAGIMRSAVLGAFDHQESARMWALHVDAASRLADGLIGRMPAGGRIVLIGSRAALGGAGRGQYGATKAALVAMARSWALEQAKAGITVNVVSPAATETPMLVDPDRGSLPPRMPPMGRLVRPEEVAATVAFLLTPDAAAITGQTIMVCGGASL